MFKKSIPIIFLITLLFAFTGCSKGSVYNTKTSNKYKEIKSIQGISFEVPINISQQATAITEINGDTDFSYSETYSYKDGKSNYLLFNMSSYIIIASNDVDYNINSTNKSAVISGLNNYYMLGLRIDADEDITYESKKKKNTTKIIAKVDTELILTTEFYNNFYGKLAYITTGTDEYALFIGLKTDNPKSITEDEWKTINYVAKSLKINANTSSAADNDVVVDDNKNPATKPNEEPKDDVKEEETPVEDTKPDIDKEPEVTPEPIPNPEPKPEPTPTPKPEPESPKETVEIEDKPVPNAGIVLNNQETKDEVINDEPLMSNVYSMLSLGQSGYMSIFNSINKKAETISVTAEEVYTGEEAIAIIKEYCESENSPYEYKAPSHGTSWNVLKYSVDYSKATLRDGYLPYVNVKVLGVDGEQLIFRGIAYSKKTHDIKDKVTSNGHEYNNYYVFYEIPNGCSEYLLEVGNGTVDLAEQGILAAYYMVNVKGE